MAVGAALVHALGQTSADLSKKYGPALDAFEVRRGVLVTARYTGGGQVCEMVIEVRRRTGAGFDLGTKLTDETVEQLIDELVPETDRGKRDESYGWSMSLGQSLRTNYSYENVEITSAGNRDAKHMAVLIKWKNRVCKAPE